MALSYKNDTQQDDRLNPAHKSPSSPDLQQLEQAGYDERFNDIVNNSNLADLKDREAESNGLYRPRSAYAGTANSKAASRYMTPGNMRAIVKKRGVLGLIATLILGGGAAGFLLFSPGLAIIQLKETMTNDLNDQLAAMDIRSSHVFLAKMKGLQADGSICSGAINIRCKFSTLSGTSVKNFKAAGITLDCGGNPCKEDKLSRNRVTKITFPDGKVFENPGAATRYARSNPQAASAMRKAYNPAFAGLSDAPAMKALSSLRTSKKNVLTGTTKEENDKIVRESVRSGVNTDGRLIADHDGKNNSYTQEADKLDNALTERANQVNESGVKASSSLLSGTVKSIGILGTVDTACTAYRTGLAIEAGAKAVRAEQLARFAMLFLVTADATKAGDVTPEQVEYIGNILTATDDRKTITVPSTAPAASTGAASTETIDNPMYGKNAFDSAGYAVAAYNEAPVLSGPSQQYTVGGTGGLLASLAAINEAASVISDPEGTCGVVQSPFVRVGSLIVGVFAGIFSGGASIAINVAANVSFNVAMSFAEQMLIDLLAGTAVDETTTGPQAGDAVFAGSAVIMSRIAATRGLSPLTLDGVKRYSLARAESQNLTIAIDKYEAQENPYDVTNKYTFVGSLAQNFNLVAMQSQGNVLTAARSLAILPLKLTTAQASQSTFNPERYERCDDPTYTRLKLAADVFCNLRYGLSDSELDMDTDMVVDYMLGNNAESIQHIDPTTGEPKSNEFIEYVKYCIDRTDPIGSAGGEENNDPEAAKRGEICYSQEGNYPYFRVYLVDKSISDGIDEEPLPSEVSPTPGITDGSLENSGSANQDGWSFPTTAGAPITGSRFLAPSGSSFGHPGLDIGLHGPDVPIYATRGGTVVSAGDITTSGYQQPCAGTGMQQVVVLRHDFDRQTYFSSYHHVANGSITVRPGQTVKAGDRIATMGNTGCSTAQHLHFEIWRDRIFQGTAVDPTPIFYN